MEQPTYAVGVDIGGGMMDTEFDRFAGAMRARLAPATQFTQSAVQVVRAVLGNDAGLVGAARLAFGLNPLRR
jgi:predicted NBD/HSP70 family sugar kinase